MITTNNPRKKGSFSTLRSFLPPSHQPPLLSSSLKLPMSQFANKSEVGSDEIPSFNGSEKAKVRRTRIFPIARSPPLVVIQHREGARKSR